MSFGDLPKLTLYKIADFLKDETPFRDKVDIAIDAVSLKIAGFNDLAIVLIETLDPTSKDGNFSPILLKNLIFQKNQYITEATAKLTWGLNNDDLAILKPKKNRYKLQEVKRLSAFKFENSYEKLKANKNQLRRYNILQQVLNSFDMSIRPDSKFCESFIKTGKGDPQCIAKILKEMEFYHLFTEYHRYFNVYKVIYSCEYGYYDRNHISDDAKKKALSEFVKNHPDKLNIIPNSLHRFM